MLDFVCHWAAAGTFFNPYKKGIQKQKGGFRIGKISRLKKYWVNAARSKSNSMLKESNSKALFNYFGQQASIM